MMANLIPNKARLDAIEGLRAKGDVMVVKIDNEVIGYANVDSFREEDELYNLVSHYQTNLGFKVVRSFSTHKPNVPYSKEIQDILQSEQSRGNHYFEREYEIEGKLIFIPLVDLKTCQSKLNRGNILTLDFGIGTRSFETRFVSVRRNNLDTKRVEQLRLTTSTMFKCLVIFEPHFNNQ